MIERCRVIMKKLLILFQEFKFRLIRVENPRLMVVNGKKLGKDTQAGVQMSIFKKFT